MVELAGHVLLQGMLEFCKSLQEHKLFFHMQHNWIQHLLQCMLAYDGMLHKPSHVRASCITFLLCEACLFCSFGLWVDSQL
jgi:hypothetical protein